MKKTNKEIMTTILLNIVILGLIWYFFKVPLYSGLLLYEIFGTYFTPFFLVGCVFAVLTFNEDMNEQYESKINWKSPYKISLLSVAVIITIGLIYGSTFIRSSDYVDLLEVEEVQSSQIKINATDIGGFHLE